MIAPLAQAVMTMTDFQRRFLHEFRSGEPRDLSTAAKTRNMGTIDGRRRRREGTRAALYQPRREKEREAGTRSPRLILGRKSGRRHSAEKSINKVNLAVPHHRRRFPLLFLRLVPPLSP